jgi:hypothetical protein
LVIAMVLDNHPRRLLHAKATLLRKSLFNTTSPFRPTPQSHRPMLAAETPPRVKISRISYQDFGRAVGTKRSTQRHAVASCVEVLNRDGVSWSDSLSQIAAPVPVRPSHPHSRVRGRALSQRRLRQGRLDVLPRSRYLRRRTHPKYPIQINDLSGRWSC